MSEPLILTPGDKLQPVWSKLVTHLTQQLNDLRGQNDGPKDEVETATLRGKIAVIKRLLELDKEQPIVEPPVVAKF